MTKQEILDRKESLLKDRKHHEGMQLLLDGALQDCDFWLKALEEQELETEKS